MKIIYVLTRIPSLDAKGDQLVYFYRIKSFLKIGYEIELILLLFPNRINNYQLQSLKKLGIKYKIFELNKRTIFLNFFKRILKLDFYTPFQVSIYFHPLAKKLIEEFSSNNKNIILFGLLRSCAIYSRKNTLIGIDLIDSLSLNFYMRYKNSKNILKKLIYFYEFVLLRNYEKMMVYRSKFSFIVSYIDKSFIGIKNITVLQNGVDNKKFYPSNSIIKNRIIFSGNMNYQPNIEAVIWFMDNCFKELKTLIPEFEFVICGANPSNKLLIYQDKFNNIKVTGKVNSIAKEISKSTLAIAPMISGSGLQNKILEAMSCSIPVLTTTKGKGDINAKINKDLLVADTPIEFNKIICKVISDPTFARRIGLNGRSFVLKNFNWDNHIDIIEKTINIIKTNDLK